MSSWLHPDRDNIFATIQSDTRIASQLFKMSLGEYVSRWMYRRISVHRMRKITFMSSWCAVYQLQCIRQKSDKKFIAIWLEIVQNNIRKNIVLRYWTIFKSCLGLQWIFVAKILSWIVLSQFYWQFLFNTEQLFKIIFHIYVITYITYMLLQLNHMRVCTWSCCIRDIVLRSESVGESCAVSRLTRELCSTD